ncbi:MAG: HPP family protein [Planctomycetota bacterium]
MKVSEIMTRRFESVREDGNLLEAMALLRESLKVGDEVGIKCVVVLDTEDRMCGVLPQSDVGRELLYPYFVRDLAGARAERPEFLPADFEALGAWARRLTVRDVMTRDPVTIGPGGTGFEAADLLLRHRIKALPVVEGGSVVGIVYRSSLYRRLAESVLESSPSPAEQG